jgi:8-oxo-dGTP pyrophosphatase MutT (NUDIX family)
LTEPLPGEAAHATMATKLRLSIQPNDKTRYSAVLILFYQYKDEIYIPLILRPEYDGVHAGQMAFPGGRRERKDKDLIETALREAQEEIGIKASDVHILGTLTQMFIPPSNFFALPVIGYLDYKPDFYPDPHEVDTVFEVSLSEISNEDIKSTTEISTRGFVFDAPCYTIQNRKIWGATSMMIAELLEVLK